ncbi:MAG: hypothetical protein KGL66_12970 [Alphaproteobacteria bacterium]|nr:hypothetical protein [Alphaproteobacteria bacterium]MDE2352795.1 hypothetical protein [Alphaproteobacteria bacterium]
MEAPIHAANEVDKDEGTTKVVAAIAGLVIILVTVGVAYYSGFWSPPATSVSQVVQHVQTQSQSTKTP